MTYVMLVAHSLITAVITIVCMAWSLSDGSPWAVALVFVAGTAASAVISKTTLDDIGGKD